MAKKTHHPVPVKLILLFCMMAAFMGASTQVPVFSRPFRTIVTDVPKLANHQQKAFFSFQVPNHSSVLAYYEYFSSASGKASLNTTLERGDFYRNCIMTLLRKYNLPDELFFLPVVESDFVNAAVSVSGAGGIWQFMPTSGYPFDLRINDYVDERKDFLKATDGALRKLKENYDALGDWYLAIAAYNCGLGAMLRAVKEAGSTDYFVIRDKGLLSAETSSYVPKFLAVMLLGSYPGRQRMELSWSADPKYEELPLTRDVDLILLSSVTGLDLAVLLAANAAWHKPYLDSRLDRGTIKFPAEYKPMMKSLLSDLSVVLVLPPIATPEDPLKNKTHLVKKGETLWSLSKLYNVEMSSLITANPVLASGHALNEGDLLAIPDAEK